MEMAYLINDQTGDAVEIPEGESTVGRGPLLKVNLAGMMAANQYYNEYNITRLGAKIWAYLWLNSFTALLYKSYPTNSM